jgi:hypothetical protein
MQVIRRVPVLVSWGLATFSELRAEVGSVRPPLSRREATHIGMLALTAVNSWSILLRTYYLASMTGAWLSDGSRAANSVNVHKVDEAITFAVHWARPHLAGQPGPWTYRDEPSWADGGIVAALLSAAGASTAGGFAAAVSLGTSSREELATYRNFVAHANRHTARKMRNLALSLSVDRTLPVIEIPLQWRRHRPQSIFADWIDDLWTMASLFPR